ncbi:MAG TPA: WD40 repeat domain-containing protein [Planctomycetota bacterium]
MLVALLLPLLPCAPQDPAGPPPSFHRDVRPILQAHCQGCHQPANADAGVDLTRHAAILAGGKHGAILDLGEVDASAILKAILPFDGEAPEMPKDRPPLGADQVGVIRRWIAAGALDDTPPALRAPVDAAHPPVYPRPPILTAVDYSPDGSLLAVSGHHEVLLHRADGSELVARLIGMSERIESVAFSPDGTRLAVAGGLPGRMGELQIWNVADAKLLLSVPVTYDTLYGASWSPDGTLVAFGCADHSLRVVRAANGEEVLFQGAHGDWVLDTAFSVDGSHLVSVGRDRSMKLVKVDTQQFIDNITSITPGALKGGLMALARHPLRDELLVGGADGIPKVYRMFREKKRVIGDDFNLLRAFDAMPGRVFAVDWTADGARVAGGSSHQGRGFAQVWNAEDGASVWKAELPSAVYALDFDPAGNTLAAVGYDGRVRLLDAASGAVRHEFVPVPLAVHAEGRP